MEEEAEIVPVEKAYIKLTEGRYPQDASKDDKHSIRRKANTLVVQDGMKVCFVDELMMNLKCIYILRRYA